MCEKFENEKKRKRLTFRCVDLSLRFSVIFLPMIWISMEGEGDEIKSKQASKRGRTWPFTLKWLLLDGRTSLIVSYHYTSSSTLFFNNPQCAMKTHCDTFYDSFFCFYTSYDINFVLVLNSPSRTDWTKITVSYKKTRADYLYFFVLLTLQTVRNISLLLTT